MAAPPPPRGYPQAARALVLLHEQVAVSEKKKAMFYGCVRIHAMRRRQTHRPIPIPKNQRSPDFANCDVPEEAYTSNAADALQLLDPAEVREKRRVKVRARASIDLSGVFLSFFPPLGRGESSTHECVPSNN